MVDHGGAGDYRQESVTDLQCHMKWIAEMMTKACVPPGQKEGFVKNTIAYLLDWKKESEKLVTPFNAVINIRLMLAAFYAHDLNYSEALNWLNEAVKCLGECPPKESREHYQAFKYLIVANRCLINEERRKRGVGIQFKTLEEIFNTNNNPLTMEHTDGFRAVLYVAEGYVAKYFGLQEDQIYLFQSAAELDPGHAEWHRALYRALRKQRRDSMPGSMPTRREQKAVKDAFDLDSEDCLSIKLFASMLDEEAKAKRTSRRDRDFMLDETMAGYANRIVDLMRLSLEKNPEDCWTHVRLAEVYGYGFYPNLDHREGERLFQQCESNWPDSSMVLHKFGKYYYLRNEKDKALKYYTHALDVDASNYPCLMDYLKCQKSTNDYSLMLTMTEKCFDACLHPPVVAMRLLLIKGILMWLMGDDEASRNAACQAFIEAAKRSPESCGEMAFKLTRGKWDIIGDFDIETSDLVDQLQCVNESDDSESAEDVVTRLILELKESERNLYHQPMLLRCNSNMSLNSNSSSSTYRTARSTFSEADRSDNWRSSSPPPPNVNANRYIPPHLRGRDHAEEDLSRSSWNQVPSDTVWKKPNSNGSTRQNNRRNSEADNEDNWRRGPPPSSSSANLEIPSLLDMAVYGSSETRNGGGGIFQPFVCPVFQRLMGDPISNGLGLDNGNGEMPFVIGGGYLAPRNDPGVARRNKKNTKISK